MADRLLRLGEVSKLLGCSLMQLWRLRFDERYQILEFPKPVEFDRFPKFKESEILDFADRRQLEPMRIRSQGQSSCDAVNVP